MKISGDVHFDGWPRANVKNHTFEDSPGFCVLRMVDADRCEHQFFLKHEYLARARLVAAAFNEDIAELRRLIDIADVMRAGED